MQKLALVFGILGLFNFSFAAETVTLETRLSPGNLPTQRVNPGTENIEVLRVWMTAADSKFKTDEKISLKKIKFERKSDNDRDQILRYKLQHKNKILGKISLPDRDILSFNNLNLEIPFGTTIEFRILADISQGDIEGTHEFQISRADFIETGTSKDPDFPIIKNIGFFPIKSNKIIIGKDFKTPSEECNLREEPVCGVDGKTYFNLCIPYQKNIAIDYEGACYNSPTIPLAPCPETSAPICGVDNRTYENQCFADRKGVFKQYEGACFPSGFRDPNNLADTVDIFELKKNELLQLRPRISEDSAQRLQGMGYLLANYQFADDQKKLLRTKILSFVHFAENPSDRTRLEQEIEALRIFFIMAKSESARQKFNAQKIPFLDVDDHEWFYGPVKFMRDKGWISGYQNTEGEETGLFRPENPVTKSEATKMVYALADIAVDNDPTEMPRNAAAHDHWARNIIFEAEWRNLSMWQDAPNPDKKAERGEVLKLIFETLGTDVPKKFARGTFPDVEVENPYFNDVEWAHFLGIISGYPDGTFRPNEQISRAEIAKIIQRASEKLKSP